MDNVADIYELSPMQQGMLFHTVASPDSGMYVEQTHCRVRGPLDLEAFRQTWERVFARHTILRSAFFWEELEKPLQVVHEEIALPLHLLDWRERAPDEREAALRDWLAADAARGFEVDSAPLQRLTLIRLDEAQYHFIWTFHHLLLDGWSVAILFEEVFAIYAGLRHGAPVPLEPAPAYRDYIAWLQTHDRDHAERFWRERLAGFITPSSLREPTAADGGSAGDASAGDASAGEGAAKDRAGSYTQAQLALDAETSAALADWAKREGITQNTAIQGAWALLLARYSRRDDVVFGATMAERPPVLADIDRMVGLCINTLPVRVQVAGDVLPGPWLRELQERQIAAAAYSATSLLEIQRWSEVPAGVALFDSLVVFENYPLSDVASNYRGVLDIADLQLVEHTNYPATLIAVPGARIQLTISYDTGHFAPTAIDRLLAHLSAILGAFVRGDVPLGRIVLVSGEEQRLLQRWGNHAALTASESVDAASADADTDTELTAGCLHERFALQVARTPEATAVRCEGTQCSYAELDACSDRLARALRTRGVGPGTRVGLCVERSLSTVSAILGILKAGGAYVPLDPASPAERLSFMVEDAGLAHLVLHRELRERFADQPTHVVEIDQLGEIITGADADADTDAADDVVAADLTPAHPAYLIYTSGSTGRPKGVQVTHANVTRLFTATAPWFQFGPDDVWTLFHSYAFDFSVWELWGALLYGGCVVVVPYWISRNPTAFIELLSEERVTILNQTPSGFYQLERADADVGLPLALRCVVFGGEALDLARLRPWMDRHGDDQPQLINMYGITETTVHVTYRPIRRGDVEASRGSLIGVPIPDLALTVLDAHGLQAPIGVAGELCVGGAGVALGYLGRPELTAERFVGDEGAPAGLPKNARWYRSGDLVRYLEDGELEYLGRIDQQVKIRGFRIELGEIESALREHPEVGDGAVIVREDVRGHKQLVGYAVPAQHASAANEEHASALIASVLAALRERLPAYMVPSHLVVLPALPLTINGKLDHRALPVPQKRRAQSAGPALRTATETALAELWSEVLGTPVTSRDANFFTLGGDSILAMQVVSRGRAVDLDLSPRLLFREQSVAAIAAALDAGSAAGAGESADQRADREARLAAALADTEVPLTPIQRWFAELEAPNPHHFNQSLLLEVASDIAPDALQSALDQLVELHPALRLHWRRDAAGTWVQQHAPAAPVPLDRQVLDGANEDSWRVAIAQAATRAQQGLNLYDGPLLRAAWIATSERRRLLLVAHHTAVDGVSWRILVEDLAELLSGRAPQPASQPYASWARMLEERGASPALAADADVWAAQIVDLAPEDDNRSLSGDRETDGALYQLELDAGDTRALLQDVHAAYRTSVPDLCLTALALAHRAVSGASILHLALESHGRQDLDDAEGPDLSADLGRTVGWCTSLYPARLELPRGDDLGAALCEIKEQLRALPAGGVSYGLLRYLHPDPDVRARLTPARPLPVVFNYLGQLDSAAAQGPFLGLSAEDTGADAAPDTPRPHALNIAAYVRGGRLVVDWQYGAGHRESDVALLAGAFHDALRTLLSHCQAPSNGGLTPSDLPLAGLDRAGVDSLLGEVAARAPRASVEQAPARTIADAYPLSPLQAGMLFHSLLQPAQGAYIEQVCWNVGGTLDVDAFRAAWDHVAARHAVFRTAFYSAGLPQPLQVVFQRVSTPWELRDWRHLDATAQTRARAEFLAEDRARGIALEHAPLLRWTIIRTGEGRYQCVWTHHHLLLDGWSIANAIGELLATYAAQVRGEPAILPRAARYRDYIAWLRARDQVADEHFWRQRLVGVDEPTPLPAARIAAGAENAHGEISFALDAAETEALTVWSRAQRITLNTLIQGAWALLLSCYSGHERVVFGATIAIRPPLLAGVEELVGLCLNTVPVCADIDARQSPGDWLRALQEHHSAAEPHAAAPLTAIKSWSGIASGQSLFESIVVFENYPVSEALHADAEALAISDAHIQEQTDLPLTLIALPEAELGLKLSYSRAHYEPATIEQLLRHLARIVCSLAQAERLADVTPMSTDERTRVLRTWNATEAPFPREATLVELLDAQRARTPDAIAVSDEHQRLSYRELGERAHALARYLRARGVGPESRVGVCMQRSNDLVVALLGVLHAGGAYVPVDPDYPEERLGFLVDDAECSLVLTQQELIDTGRAVPGALAIDADWATIAAAPPVVLPTMRPEHPAYLIYTSGSTGRPKGVINSHGAIVNRLWWMQETYGLGVDDVVLQKTPYSFDVSVWEFFWPLLTGARLHMARPGGHLDRRYLVDTILAERVSTIHFVPSMLQVFLEEPRLDKCDSLKRVICSGEALPLALQQRFLATSRASLYNLYGPTEAAIDVSHWTCEDTPDASSVPIGRPIANTQLYILDRAYEPVAPGIAGELYIGGVNLARGYHRRPGLTAERFVPDPHSATPGARMYRTGDLARFRPDGAIEYLGRTDFQVKVRGFRIELGEIEYALASHPGVAESVVVAQHSDGDARLIGYYTCASTEVAPPDEQALRVFLRQRLPAHMVPNRLMKLAAMPLSANGKLNRKALPAPGRQTLASQAPRTELERQIAAIWCELLGVESADVETSFFDLGGHSVLLIQAHARLESLLGRSFPLLTLFEHPSIGALARHLGQPTVNNSDDGGAGDAIAPAVRQASQRKQQTRRRRAARIDDFDD